MSLTHHRARPRTWASDSQPYSRAEAQEKSRSSGSHCALHVTLIVAPFLIGALVEELLTLAESERNLRFAALEVELERDEGEALPFHRTDHLPDLFAVEQQLARARRLVIEVARLFVRRYVQVQQKNFSILNDRVRISDVGLSVSQRFDFAAGQHHSRFPGVEDVVVVARAFVPRDRLLGIFLDFLCH